MARQSMNTHVLPAITETLTTPGKLVCLPGRASPPYLFAKKEKLPLRTELGILSSGHISHSDHASENTRRLSTASPTVPVSLGLNLSTLPKKSIF